MEHYFANSELSPFPKQQPPGLAYECEPAQQTIVANWTSPAEFVRLTHQPHNPQNLDGAHD